MNTCPICGGVNSANCYRCRGRRVLASRDNPRTCPICGKQVCSCPPEGQR